MKKILFCLSLALILRLTACGGETPSPTDTSDTTVTESETADPTTDTVTEASTEIPTETPTETPTEAESEAGPVKTFQNPILDRAAADPCIVYHDGYYYGTYTEALGIALYRSTSLETVFSDEKVQIFSLCDEVQGNIWAPELFYNPSTDRWYVYSCGSFQGWDFFTIRMFCLESKTNDPFGEYEFKGFTDPDVLAIDQTMFYDDATGTLYTAYSEFTDAGQVIMVAVMENPWTISDKRIRVSHPRHTWEKKGERADKDSRVNEGPVFLEHDGKLSLIYSASGCWSQYYCLGLVEFEGENFSVDEMMNRSNWNKLSHPVFSAANEVYGVGHCSFFLSPDGSETWIAYHGMPTPDAGEEGRFSYAQKITFDEKGLPVLGEPLSRDTDIRVPSGEKIEETE
ncbi:MAG: glycoside hydrolase family 43 protein [Clostridia bacterium]|nr:glycoside hydrolase family 43 protein [Clostridia bacterium]